MKEILVNAVKNGQKTLSEFESKKILKSAGVPVTKEFLAGSKAEALKMAKEIGYPVALKGSGHKVAHKTELGLVKLRIDNDNELSKAYDEIMGKGAELDGVLVQEMINGGREFIMGLSRDPQFGPCVMFGLGGIFAEVLKDVSFRVAPLKEADALEMINEIKTSRLLDEFRGSPGVDKPMLAKVLVGLGNLALDYKEIAEIDVNPLIIANGKPIAVDSLVVLS
ncbi:MAG: acetate--CoA ligase family protein [Spirochaetota bacterium]